MSIVRDILRTYRAPREVLGARIGASVREDRALAVLMGACAVIFVAQWPRLAREAYLDAAIGLDARIMGALFAWIVIAPLAFYVFAFVVHLVLRAAGRPATGYAVRMAVFWGLLAAGPLFLLTGLVSGLIGAGGAARLVSALAAGALLVFWGAGLALVAGPGRARET